MQGSPPGCPGQACKFPVGTLILQDRQQNIETVNVRSCVTDTACPDGTCPVVPQVERRHLVPSLSLDVAVLWRIGHINLELSCCCRGGHQGQDNGLHESIHHETRRRPRHEPERQSTQDRASASGSWSSFISFPDASNLSSEFTGRLQCWCTCRRPRCLGRNSVAKAHAIVLAALLTLHYSMLGS